MKKDIIEDSLICLANAKLNDTSYEVARDIALDYIIDLQERINKALDELYYLESNCDITELGSIKLKQILKGDE